VPIPCLPDSVAHVHSRTKLAAGVNSKSALSAASLGKTASRGVRADRFFRLFISVHASRCWLCCILPLGAMRA
jgi:hypothetical protein